jgi:hypothetical protein
MSPRPFLTPVMLTVTRLPAGIGPVPAPPQPRVTLLPDALTETVSGPQLPGPLSSLTK